MGTKSIDPRYVRNVGRILREILARDFPPKDGEVQGGQRRAAKVLRISQSQISDLTSDKPGKGVGLPTLLALRKYTNRSVDDLLGLGPLPNDELADQIRATLETMLKAREAGRELPRFVKAPAVRALPPAPPPPANVVPIVTGPGKPKPNKYRTDEAPRVRAQNRELREAEAAKRAAEARAAKKHKRGGDGAA